MLPSALSNFMPSSLVELILDLISINASMDVADSRAFVESDAIALVWEIPKAVKTKAK
jgi:hypothetical protein